MTHICVSKLTIIGSDNGLSPERRQAIIRTNAGILLIGPLGTNFSEILIETQTFSLKKIHLKMSSAQCCSFRLGLNVLMNCCFHLTYHVALVTITKRYYLGARSLSWVSNSFGLASCVAESYQSPIVKWVAVTWQEWEGTRIVVSTMAVTWHTLLSEQQSKLYSLIISIALCKTVVSNGATIVRAKPLVCSWVLTPQPLGDPAMILKVSFSNLCLRLNSWALPVKLISVACHRTYWWSVNITSGNGLVPSGTKPLPDPLLTEIYAAICCY